MPAPKKYPDELRERAVRLVFESGRPIAHVANDLGVHRRRCAVGAPGRGRCRHAPRSADQRRARAAQGLEREVRELRKANEILKAASVYFAKELDPTRPK